MNICIREGILDSRTEHQADGICIAFKHATPAYFGDEERMQCTVKVYEGNGPKLISFSLLYLVSSLILSLEGDARQLMTLGQKSH